MRSYLVPVYVAYLLATVGLCLWLARTLSRNGAVFLADLFDDRPELAEAVNRLLVTGFAMVNLGYGFFLLDGGQARTGREAMEVLARKLGILLVSLAAVHFANLLVFHWIGSRRRRAVAPPAVGSWAATPPPAPGGWAPPMGARPYPPAPARPNPPRPNPPAAGPAPAGSW